MDLVISGSVDETDGVSMKLGTRLIIFSSIFLILLPWLAYQFVDKVEKSLLQAQEEAQSMTASAIAMVLNGYTGLFEMDEHALYVYPIRQSIDIDGYDEDWLELEQRFISLTMGQSSASDQTSIDNNKQSDVSLLLVNKGSYLYAYIRVKDDDIVYRHPRYRYLDSSDHVRLELLDEDGQRRRFILLGEAQGQVSAYEVDDDWRMWKSGRHVNAIYGVWQETGSGYDLELRLPLSWLNEDRRLSFSVANVYGENERYLESVVSTHSPGNSALNPLLFRSKEISKVIKNLSGSDSRICVIDSYRRVRAVIGGHELDTSLCHATDRVNASLVSTALAGSGQVTRFEQGGEMLIVAAQPILDADEVIGTVLVSKNSRQILSQQRETLRDIVVATLILFALVFFSLLSFSSWLAYRINRLKKQASALIDDSGRFTTDIELPDTSNRDEIGELSRSFASLLEKLNAYTRFLETVPRMLRHEILNPVNSISMSLQNGSGESQVAENAIKQLQLIVYSLTEAANIDEVLAHDEVEDFDIAVLLAEYVASCQLKHPDTKFLYSGEKQGIRIKGNDLRLVQLLDKLKDNAIDFALPGSEVVFELSLDEEHEREQRHDRSVIIRIKNEGELIPQSVLDNLFRGMTSHRTAKSDTPHLGIGLYVAHQIARFHGGKLQITNRRDKQGVEVSLVLPGV